MNISPQAKQECQRMLATKAGVTGFSGDIRQKITNGERTDIPCVRVYVTHKKPLPQIHLDDVVPVEVDGLPTDVIEAGVAVTDAVDRFSQQRPAPRGISVGYYAHSGADLGTGTLSVCVDNVTGDIVDLSNCHVLANSDNDVNTRAFVGDTIVQPGTNDGGGSPTDDYALLERWVQLSIAGTNLVDAAISVPNDADDLNSRILNEYDEDSETGLIVTGHATPTVDMAVAKSGRTTGYTEGVIVDVNYNGNVIYMKIGETLYFEEQILTTLDSAGGDSGSLVFTRDDELNVRAVGIHFAHGGFGWASHVDNIMTELNVNFNVASGGTPDPPPTPPSDEQGFDAAKTQPRSRIVIPKLTKTADAHRTRTEIETQFQTKTHIVHDTKPDDNVGQVGERRLRVKQPIYYNVVKTTSGWIQSAAEYRYCTEMPSDDEGILGEMQLYYDGEEYHVIAKTKDGWQEVGGAIEHGRQKKLLSDDHPQYIHLARPRRILARHMFNPWFADTSPFRIGDNAWLIWVEGLNADQVDGYDAADFGLFHPDSTALSTSGYRPVYLMTPLSLATFGYHTF